MKGFEVTEAGQWAKKAFWCPSGTQCPKHHYWRH